MLEPLAGGARRARGRVRPLGAGRAGAAARGGRRRRRARRQRRAARVSGRLDSFSRRADRPRAGGQPARADAARPGAARRRWSRAAAGTCCSCPRCRARRGAPGSSVYAATKFGLRGFALALREDLAPKGVGVSVILPGFIRDAGMFAESGAKLPPYVGTKRPEDVARAVVKAIEHDRAEIDVAPLAAARGRHARRTRPRADRRDPAPPRRRGHGRRRSAAASATSASRRAAVAAPRAAPPGAPAPRASGAVGPRRDALGRVSSSGRPLRSREPTPRA